MVTKKRLKPWVKILLGIICAMCIIAAVFSLLDFLENRPTIQQGSINNVNIEEEQTEEGEYISSNDPLNFFVIDVGNGQSLFVDYGTMEVLIDAGEYDKGQTVLDTIKPYVDGNLEYVIATHSHADHVGGLPKIYETFEVEKTIYGDLDKSNDACNYFMKAAKKEGVMGEDSDTVIELGKNASITIFDVVDGDKNTNNNSVITLIQYGETYFFASGDAEKDAEILLRDKLPKCDVVVAGHHGSSTSNTLLDELEPGYFIISAGKNNDYGHPHKEVLEKALKETKDIFGTWKSGTIKFVSDGLTVNCSADNSTKLTQEDKE